jgi:fructose-bisphosphate aldolase, class II
VNAGFLEFGKSPRWLRACRNKYGFPVFLNADHTHSLAGAIEAAKAGFDWVVFDISTLPLEENIRQTRVAVETLKSIRPEILVEGEIGDIGSGSKIHDSAPDLQKGLTAPDDEAKRFVEETGIDTLAPAVGNMHGMLKSMVSGGAKKRLDIDRIRQIKKETHAFMTTARRFRHRRRRPAEGDRRRDYSRAYQHGSTDRLAARNG